MTTPFYVPTEEQPGLLQSAARFSFQAVAGLHLLRLVTRSSTRILMYHRFPESAGESFRRQCRHLARNYAVIGFNELSDCFQSGRALPPNAVIITIDDGYRDFYLTAWPILREFGLTATVFLISGFLDGQIWPSGDQIEYAVRHTQLPEATISFPSGEAVHVRLHTAEEKWNTVWKLKDAAKRAPVEAAEELVKILPQQLGVTMPDSIPAEYAPLRLDDIRAMQAAGIDFGAHTTTHPILTRISDTGRLRREIHGCRTRLETLLQIPIRHFCYPNGDWDERSLNLVRESGFDTAVTTKLGLNRSTTDPFLLRRIGVDPSMPIATFRHYTAGSVANILGGA